MGGRLVS